MFGYVVTRHIMIRLITIHIVVFLNFLADEEISLLRGGEWEIYRVWLCVLVCGRRDIISLYSFYSTPVTLTFALHRMVLHHCLMI